MKARELLTAGALLAPAGVCAALIIDPMVGGVLLSIGVGAALLGLHRFGRSGADPFDGKSDLDA